MSWNLIFSNFEVKGGLSLARFAKGERMGVDRTLVAEDLRHRMGQVLKAFLANRS
jgi:hypothetical protein